MNIHKKKLVVRGKLSNKLTCPLSYLGKRGRRFRVKMKFEGEPKVQSDIGRYEREREKHFQRSATCTIHPYYTRMNRGLYNSLIYNNKLRRSEREMLP